MTATTTSGTVEHDDYPAKLLMEARAEIERLRAALRSRLCPGHDTITVAECVAMGHCGCTDGLLVSGHETKNASDHS